MWAVTGGLLLIWFILKFVMHKGGFIHILLLTALSIAGVQIIADRKTRYHKNSTKS
ncbi:MAG TPA: hypothetical protein VMS31_15785 [Pyrinomonadaceae bacterium]|nr:hypothetical protein [Pyrinomonadaceae bacterium]